MRCVAKRIIVTRQSIHRICGWIQHRRKRVAKKYGEDLIYSPDALRGPQEIISDLHYIQRYVEITERCERQVARFLRRSGLTIKTYSRAQVADMLRAGTWPPGRASKVGAT